MNSLKELSFPLLKCLSRGWMTLSIFGGHSDFDLDSDSQNETPKNKNAPPFHRIQISGPHPRLSRSRSAGVIKIGLGLRGGTLEIISRIWKASLWSHKLLLRVSHWLLPGLTHFSSRSAARVPSHLHSDVTFFKPASTMCSAFQGLPSLYTCSLICLST